MHTAPQSYGKRSRVHTFRAIGKLTEHDDYYHPTLGLSIIENIARSDMVFLMLTPFCHWRRWLDFEIKVAIDRSRPIIAIRANEDVKVSPDIRVYCQEVISWDEQQILAFAKHGGLMEARRPARLRQPCRPRARPGRGRSHR